MPLTQEQQDFLAAEGKIVLCAVPGSGKTYVVAEKMVKSLVDWSRRHQGIAALSFTNVASEEIKKQIANSTLGLSEVGYPHFIGTLDSFINNFIFLRFGYLMPPPKRKRPVIVHDNYGELSFSPHESICYKQGCATNPTKLHWSIDGLCKDGKPVDCEVSPKPCINYKNALYQKGIFITHLHTLKILRKIQLLLLNTPSLHN